MPESESARWQESGAVCEDLIGVRLGAYRVRQELGRGGMGSVYLAHRDDDQYSKKVAIKVIRRGLDTEDVLARFRHERQILATLDHPYVAHLIDGGTTPDGRPYLVMEYVEGQPIHTYCRAHGLTLPQRLELFCQVCEAVSFAHRNLVVHRDIKPSNILITAAGSPKLLDFGIAKLLQSSEPGHTQTMTATAENSRMLTPDYASPEQIRGMPVSTSSDVYSLGVVLYELLTGNKLATPHAATGERLPTGRISRDLGNILRMAMRTEPDRRYPSADEFAADIRRYLDGRPVSARRDTVGYRVSKFVARHRWGVIAAGAVITCLIAGAALAAWQASVAQKQRAISLAQRRMAEEARSQAESEARVAHAARVDAESANRAAGVERDRAVRETTLAKNRLHEMIRLANKTVFDMHDQLASLPGATEPRRKLIGGVVEYLDSITKEAESDPFVLGSLAAAYYKLGDVQGRPEHPSLGDYPAAMRSYRKSESFATANLARSPEDPEFRLMWATIQTRIAAVHREQNNPKEGVKAIEQALVQLRAIREPHASDKAVLTMLCSAHSSLLWLYSRIDQNSSEYHGRMALAYGARLVMVTGNDDNAASTLADTYSGLAAVFATDGKLKPALESTRMAQAGREALLNKHPSDPRLMRTMMLSYGRMGDILGGVFLVNNLGDPKGAVEQYKKAVALAEKIAALDPANLPAHADLATALMRAGMVDVSPGQRNESLAILVRARSILEPLFAKQPKSGRYLHDLSFTLEFIGHRLRDLGKPEEAMAQFNRSLQICKDWMTETPDASPGRVQAIADYQAMAPLAAEMGDAARAMILLEEAKALAAESAKLTARIPSYASHTPRVQVLEGTVLEILASKNTSSRQQQRACAAYRQGVESWQIAAQLPTWKGTREVEKAMQQLASCETRMTQASRLEGK